MTLENITGKLENVKQRGDGYAYAKCPAHDDDGESLTLTVLTDGEVSLMRLYALVDKTEIPFRRVGGALRFDCAELEAWTKGEKMQTKPDETTLRAVK